MVNPAVRLRRHSMAREIVLSQEKVALVSDEDFDFINQWNWHAARNKKKGCNTNWYARRNLSRKEANDAGKCRILVLMHRVIAARMFGDDLKIVDHIDRDSLNNQRCNLRNATHSQNNYNSSLDSRNKSGATGVFFRKDLARPWEAYLGRKYLGSFHTFEEAVVIRMEVKKCCGV